MLGRCLAKKNEQPQGCNFSPVCGWLSWFGRHLHRGWFFLPHHAHPAQNIHPRLVIEIFISWKEYLGHVAISEQKLVQPENMETGEKIT
jgi:hypothetical protein